MKNPILKLIIASILLATTSFAGAPLPPDVKFQGSRNEIPRNTTLIVNEDASIPSVVRKIYLGTPAVASTNAIVSSASMRVGTYTVADTTPDGTIPRNITVTHTAVSTADTLGTIVVAGTDADGTAITETLTPVNGSVATGAKAFKTVTSVTGVGWVVNSGADSVVVGFGGLVGLPVVLPDATNTALTTLGTTVAASATTGGSLATSTVDASAGTYNGSKKLYIYIDR
jgi:hypothetical protein